MDEDGDDRLISGFDADATEPASDGGGPREIQTPTEMALLLGYRLLFGLTTLLLFAAILTAALAGLVAGWAVLIAGAVLLALNVIAPRILTRWV